MFMNTTLAHTWWQDLQDRADLQALAGQRQVLLYLDAFTVRGHAPADLVARLAPHLPFALQPLAGGQKVRLLLDYLYQPPSRPFVLIDGLPGRLNRVSSTLRLNHDADALWLSGQGAGLIQATQLRRYLDAAGEMPLPVRRRWVDLTLRAAARAWQPCQDLRALWRDYPYLDGLAPLNRLELHLWRQCLQNPFLPSSL